jgi:hypothetical protein
MADRGELRRRRPEQSLLHQAVRLGWPEVVAAAEERGGFPKRVREEVQRYLACGDLRRGFTLAKCDACRESVVIAFSCKTRGWCPSCGARRAHETSEHLLAVLPGVTYRQWTLSVPFALRFTLVKEPKLLRVVERCLTRAIFRWQRKRAKQSGVTEKLQCGSVSFVQLFSSALTLQPHLHLLVPQGCWRGGAFVELPSPSQEEVEAVLARLLAQAQRTFEALEATWPQDAFEALQREAAQERLNLGDEVQPPPVSRLVAVQQGFSLHAGTKTHANDKEALARLCRYGARCPVAESRLTRRDDGKYAYETKKGVTLVLTAAQLVRRLIALIPPARFHLTSFHGVLSSHAKARADVLPKLAVPPKAAVEPAPAATKTRKPRLDWATLHARCWQVDVWHCPCGGRRKVTAVVTSRSAAEQILRNMGLWPSRLPLPLAQAPPQLELLPQPR